jgi:hypothetical protein
MPPSRAGHVKTSAVTIRLATDIKLAAEAAAIRDRRSLTNLVEVLLEQHCRSLGLYPIEDAQDVPDASAQQTR